VQRVELKEIVHTSVNHSLLEYEKLELLEFAAGAVSKNIPFRVLCEELKVLLNLVFSDLQ